MSYIFIFLSSGKDIPDESESLLEQFYKELDEKSKFVGKKSYLKSGDIAVIILFQRNLKRWIRRTKLKKKTMKMEDE